MPFAPTRAHLSPRIRVNSVFLSSVFSPAVKSNFSVAITFSYGLVSYVNAKRGGAGGGRGFSKTSILSSCFTRLCALFAVVARTRLRSI